MSSLAYHALWVGVALVLAGIASAVLTRRMRIGALRRMAAEEALEALARYAEWTAGQRRSAAFQGDRPADVAPLVRVRQLQQAWFPELAAAMVLLLEVHGRMLDFLWRQQLLRARDPEAWLESDHDGRFMALWREHRLAVHELAERLRLRAGGLLVDAQPESVHPA